MEMTCNEDTSRVLMHLPQSIFSSKLNCSWLDNQIQVITHAKGLNSSYSMQNQSN